MTIGKLLYEIKNNKEINYIKYIHVEIQGIYVANITVDVNEEDLKPYIEMGIQYCVWDDDAVIAIIG